MYRRPAEDSAFPGIVAGRYEIHIRLIETIALIRFCIALGFNDGERAALAVKGAEGKRLTYRQPHWSRFQICRREVHALA